ncbi:glycosyl hydrolase [uncultured Proteiniphilum sp.]|uniref:glycosyl hydrolase n=1 Tax=uncultured Proteiniphilum sp. TaxID=497637 RepID=UPI002609062C|nr:glycosyl hydrolase [uncultured Proteiniphilum sp.]
MKEMNLFSRRSFLKTGMVLTAGLPALRISPVWGKVTQPETEDKLYSLFRQPPVTAKPFVRWWWNGDKLSAKEILRELDVMKEAGIGGVEINPIAFPGGDDLGIPSMQWLSPEWIEMVKVALKGAEERGMVCDIIVGSGWPFGAEILEGDDRSQLLTLTSKKISGPETIRWEVADIFNDAKPRVHAPYKGTDHELYGVCLAPVQMDEFEQPRWLPFDKRQSTLEIEAPEGEHILYILVKYTGFQAVINGAPGAAGPVLNHYDKEAAEKFLNRMSDTLFPQLEGLKGFRAMFCDSMELKGANWCRDFPEEFKRRRGYDIKPYLPYILFKVGSMGSKIEGAEITQLSGDAKEVVSRARYDFYTTCMDIITDRFLTTYTRWCNRHGFKSRMQPYGNEFHPLEASLSIDIPECETWIWGRTNKDGYTYLDFVNQPSSTNVNKYVASAAHLAGKKIVSCEEITNTTLVFNTTLEQVKICGDQSNLSGVNHSILHGFNYSPVEVPFPGWVRYGTFFNERNPGWPYFKLWADYKARISVILQETEAFADIAVLHPLADMWTLHGPQRDPFPGLLYPSYQYKVWEAIHKNGNSCDYTSENIIQKSTAGNGYLKYGRRKYNTLILIEVETIQPATATALANFVAKGGKLIFVGKEPYKSPGLVNYEKNDRLVDKVILAMKKKNPSRVFTVEPPTTDIVAWFAGIQRQCGIRPYMQIDNPSVNVSQIRHRAKGRDIFFLSNASQDERVVLNVSFPGTKGVPQLWDAETGQRRPLPAANTLKIDLPPATSQLIVFEESDIRPLIGAAPLSPENQDTVTLTEWKLRMEHLDGTVQTRDIDQPFDLSRDESTRSFAGYLYYEKKLGDITGYHWLDLGKVYGVSEVSVDNEILGKKWYGRHLYALPGNASGKTLQIKITTTVGNFLKSTPENEIGYGWTRGQGWTPVGLKGPVRMM